MRLTIPQRAGDAQGVRWLL